jgi:hypothetical protein
MLVANGQQNFILRQPQNKKAAEAASCVWLVRQQQLHAVFLAEFFHSAGGVNNLLLACIEWMALRAHFDIQRLAVGGTGFELVAATAGYGDFVVIRMNVGFHSQCPCKRLSRKRAQLSKKLIN